MSGKQPISIVTAASTSHWPSARSDAGNEGHLVVVVAGLVERDGREREENGDEDERYGVAERCAARGEGREEGRVE